VPIPTAARVFDPDGRVKEASVEQQLHTLGREVVRVTGLFAGDRSMHREAECQEAAARVAAAS
jgi:hypothetical protein